jgi:PAS domain S-box-containing protein
MAIRKMPKIQKPELRRKADKIISEFKEKDLKAYGKKDLRNLIYEIEETYQAELELEVTRLRSKLEEMEETLTAIRSGEVDALIIGGLEGDKIFTLTGAEHPYRVMVETMGEGAVTLSMDGTILFSNKSFGRLVRHPLEKIVGTNITQYIDIESRSKFQSALKGSISSRLEASLTALDGSNVPVYLSTSPLEENDSPGYSVVVTDLTLQKNEEVMRKHEEFLQGEIAERKRVERELRTSEEKYRAIFEQSLDGILLTKSDGTIYAANPEACRILRMSEKEIIIANRSGIVNISDPDYKRAKRTRKRTGSFRGELVFHRKDGTLLPCEVSTRIYQDSTGDKKAIIIFRDISERKRTEATLINSEERFRLASLAAQEAIWDWSPKENKFFVNENLINLFGRPPGDNSSREWWIEHIHPDDRQRMIAGRISLRKKKVNTGETEYRFRKVDGTYAHVYDRFYLSRGPDHSIQRVVGAMLDTTKLKEAESILKERTRELENLNEELESFSRSVSHDLRAPLSAIGGFARMLKQDYGGNLDQGAHGIFDLIFGNVAMMENLIGGYLNLSRASRKEMICEKIDMDDLIRSVAEEFRAAEKVGRTSILMTGLPQAAGDPILIRQVFSNLLSNALKFVKKRKDPRVEIGGYDDADFKIYYVKDNGVGFNMKDYGQLFQIFRRLHSSSQYEGTGIGLSIVQKIVQRHGGRVWAEGKVNRGATFYFGLPRI